jgi:peptide-methionine (R)-S-oxide reductase
MTKRDALLSVPVIGGALSRLFRGQAEASETPEIFDVTKTDAEWKAALSPQAYNVLRHEATERPHTSPLNDEKRTGHYHCAGCDQALHTSDQKFDSGTGWPSFYDHLPGAVATKSDNTLFMTRTEVHCSRCGGHLGHVFDDGPAPTGLRYCQNGVSLAFKPA